MYSKGDKADVSNSHHLRVTFLLFRLRSSSSTMNCQTDRWWIGGAQICSSASFSLCSCLDCAAVTLMDSCMDNLLCSLQVGITIRWDAESILPLLNILICIGTRSQGQTVSPKLLRLERQHACSKFWIEEHASKSAQDPIHPKILNVPPLHGWLA